MNILEASTQKLSIKSWSEDDRPREKLLLKGRNSLSDAELIAILIGSGSREETAVELSKKILASVGNNLHDLAKLTISDLIKFKGIGEAKAISIAAALELGRRRKDAEVSKKVKIKSSAEAYNILTQYLSDLPHEEFWVLYLSRNNTVLKTTQVGVGGVTGTVADVKIILKQALELLASGIIVAHNHPSGNLNPSSQDKELTLKIKEASKLLDVALLDHLIITQESYFSFADNGLL